MSAQSDAVVRHIAHYLGSIDPALADLFMHAIRDAGYPGVSAADALEAICADFLAGPHPHTRVPSGHTETEPHGR